MINGAGWVDDDNGNIWGWGYFIVTMPDGSKHSIAGQSSGMYSEDGDALRLEIGTLPDQDLTVTTNDGTRIHFPTDGGTADKITDRNGNYVTITDTSITDSAGHVLTLVKSAGDYTAVQYTDSNGTLQTIQLNYTPTVLFSTDSSSSQYTNTGGSGHPFQYPQTAVGTYSTFWVDQPSANSTWPMLSSVVLPNSDTYSFTYDGWGELKKIVYPGGGYAKYDYQAFIHSEAYWAGPIGGITADFREVTAQHLCPQTTCSPEQTTTYTSNPAYIDGANEQVTVTDPSGNSSWHKFWHSDGGESMAESIHSPPQEIETQYFDNTSALLKRVVTDYFSLGGALMPFPVKVTTSLCTTGGNAVSTITTTTYDTPTLYVMAPFGIQYTYQSPGGIAEPVHSVIERDVYDYVASTSSGTPSMGPLLRKDTATFLSSSGWYGIGSATHTPSFPLTQTTYDPSINILAQTSYEYDVYSGANHAALLTSGASQLGAAPGSARRGNVTAVTKRVDASNSVTSYSQYYDSGSLHVSIDPRGYPTTYGYGSDFLYPTSVTNALSQTDAYTYFPTTGQLHTHIDPNTQTTTYAYDNVLRLTSVVQPDSGGVSFSHVNPNLIQEFIAQSAGVQVERDFLFDGLGRQIESQLMEPEHDTCASGVIRTQTTYDVSGRVWKVSNPFCTTSDSTYGEVVTAYDGLGRTSTVTQADGVSTLQWTYSGNVTNSYDETGRHWQRTSDAAGRLTDVLEPDPSTNVPTLPTHYTYDALGNLSLSDPDWQRQYRRNSPCS